MENTRPPVRIVSLGRVYRPDTIDATHSCMFHQMEGLMVDRHVTMAQLKTVLSLFARSFLGPDVEIRFRPSFFPFTEPSVEVDMKWGDSWMEIGGAGMVDPNVFAAVGYDPEQYTGFAFGLGIERFCMKHYGVDDIRRFYENDMRFLCCSSKALLFRPWIAWACSLGGCSLCQFAFRAPRRRLVPARLRRKSD